MKIIMVAAVAQNGVIGAQNSVPWYIPEDLKHFKEVTMGKPCLMGKNTYDSIIAKLGKALPGRENIVVTRQKDWVAPADVKVFYSLEEALEFLKDHKQVMIIGGGQIYAQMFPKADRLVITQVHKQIDGDVVFPEISLDVWKEVFREDHPEYSFVEYERK